MRIVYNDIIPFKGFKAVNLFGVLFVRRGCTMSETALNHERIHTVQMKEMLYVGFYVWYLVEWLMELVRYGHRSYMNNTFEREAYANEGNPGYLETRPRFAWVEYI